MPYLVKTYYRTATREAQQDGLGTQEQAQALAAGLLQDSDVTYSEIYEEIDGRAAHLIETVTRD